MKYIVNDEFAAYCIGAVVTIVYLLLVLAIFKRDRGRKNIGRFTSSVVLMSVFSVVLLLVTGLLSYSSLYSSSVFELAIPVAALLACNAGTSLPPVNLPAVAVSAISFILVLMIAVFRPSFWPGAFWMADAVACLPAVTSMLVLLSCAATLVYCLSDFRELVRTATARKYVSSLVSLMYPVFYMSLLLFSAASFIMDGIAHSICSGICLIAMLVLHIFLCLKTAGGKVFVLCRRLEMELEAAAKIQLAARTGDRARMEPGYESMYAKIEALFAERKPFLDGDLTIGDIARSLYTNKLYVSKAIGMCTGRNFCQYVNLHRIHYSMELFKSDPHLKVSQLAAMSGFHSVASFNMSFRLFMNESPSEWCRRNRSVRD